MLLSGNKIREEVEAGRIELDPFCPDQLNPNSYNLRLANELWVYDDVELDMLRENRGHYLTIPDSGLVIRPGQVYLGVSREWIGTDHYAPMVEGRSSIGRLGLSIHAAAGFCDIGFHGRITLELQVAQPLKLYPWVQLAQVCFHEVTPGATLYAGKYQNDRHSRPMPSKIWKELRHELSGVACPTPPVSSTPTASSARGGKPWLSNIVDSRW